MDGPPDVVVYGTAVIAIYGAVLATYNALLTRGRERRDRERHQRELERDERRVVVQARHVVVPDYPPLISVRAVCDGPRPVKITGFGLLMEDGRQMVAMPVPVVGPPLPASLTDGEEVTIFLDEDKLDEAERREGSRIVSVRVHDGASGEWEAPWPRSK